MTTKQMILDALKRLAGSMKVWTMVLGLITALAARYGFDVDPTMFWVVVGGFAALLGVQGANDWGSKAAQTQTTANLVASNSSNGLTVASLSSPASDTAITKPYLHVEAAPKLSVTFGGTSDGFEYDITDLITRAGFVLSPLTSRIVSVPPKANGFAKLSLLVLLSAVSVLLVGLTLVNCAAYKQEAADVKNAVVHCASSSAVALTKEFGPTVDMLLTRATDPSTGKVDFGPLASAAKNVAKDGLMCVVANVIAAELSRVVDPNAPKVAELRMDHTSLLAGFASLTKGQLYQAQDGTLLGAN